ncbi:PAS/PAC sensor signal transduction histidine kinase [Novosphingobium sp. PhB165]|uniref:sensor histidine kinase n=1 Tax=Novosphingobium sp. PhB165 TaxID=2485105 RepID=UPI0010D90750|nr:PAS domain S-box protein [Novosphingobium sp. PhB165]TCM19581.1 PAS/PAC sensor signal transduction histidine kinase [Novosphingobium sp. PhB165]
MSIVAESLAEVHAALQHAPVGSALVDRTGAISWVNPAFANMVGEADPAALRLSLMTVWLEHDDGEALLQMLEAHFATPLEARLPWTHSATFKRIDGASQPGEITLAPCAGAFDQWAIIHVRNMVRLATAEKRFSQIFENLPLGLIVIDAHQRIVQVNEALAAQFGYGIEDLVGRSMDMLLPQRYRADHQHHVDGYTQAPVARAMGSGRDLTGLHRSGREIPVEVALTRLETMAQPLYMAIVTDITLRKRGQEALEQTNAQLEEFTYVASHDLRSPLRGIADLITWIREDLGDDNLTDDVRHNFDRIALRIDRAEQMIEDLLRYARAGVRDTETEMVDPADLVEEALAMSLVPETFRVEVDIAPGISPFKAPRAPIATSLRNLLGNAIKHHGGPGGRIRVAVRENGRFTVFTVEDDGRGIPPGSEERIFKLFHRASTDTSGEGLGLSFTRRMINAHGGMITVRAKGALGGACFEIQWPRVLLKEIEDA